ncbi:mannose-1-phosphate guanylyltransferase/mannose-6-phosphate isomerase, partial [Candidatus Bathyarchaeota archaeon]
MIVPVLLAGGKGERFWPLSREGRPKQLVKFSERTLLEEAYLRAKLLGNEVLVLTSGEIEEKVRGLLPDAEVIAEPVGENTAPACYYAARLALKRWGDATLVVMPSDHVIKDRKGFAETARFAAELAGEGYLVTFGIKPTRPETGYGYIERGELLREQGEQ